MPCNRKAYSEILDLNFEHYFFFSFKGITSLWLLLAGHPLLLELSSHNFHTHFHCNLCTFLLLSSFSYIFNFLLYFVHIRIVSQLFFLL
uniref:Uncharacterized protein n=1 Tax=Arundo donax TaxID=35708 RepID=A0A0A8XZC3_ARUDO